VNCTFVGDHRQGPLWPGPSSAVNMRNGRMAGTCLNSICYEFKIGALKIDTNDIWRPHCAAIPAEPAVFCSAQTTGVDPSPIAAGSLFVTGSPNPFKSRLDVSFTLPHAGHVTVEVFAANGRRVAMLANDDMEAGNHSLTWNVGREMPSGMYFYRVRAGAAQSTGKITRFE
jgi:hypothetical protein